MSYDRKSLRLVTLACAFAAVLCAQQVGANYNHDPELIELNLLKRVPVQWIRATPYVFEYINGEKQPETSDGLARIIAAKKAGYKVAFGLRWDFRKYKLSIPEPGSPEEKKYFDVCTRILDRIGPYIDIFKLGNEPTLETLDADMHPNASGVIPLVRFTERLLTEVVEPYYRIHGGKRPPVYVGSLPALFERKMQQLPAVPALIAMAQSNGAITGLSIHLHIATEADMARSFEFVRKRIPSKPLIVPEFSLHRLYALHMTDSLGDSDKGREFASRYKRDPAMRLHQWYSLANQHKVSSEEWSAMFASRSWFPEHFLRTYYSYFQRYGVTLATYGFVSQYAPPNVPANGMAWFINPIFPFKSLPLNSDGSYPANPLWFDDFVAIVKQGRK